MYSILIGRSWMLTASNEGLVQSAEGDVGAFAGSNGVAGTGVMVLAVWAIVVTVALGVLAVVVYRKLKHIQRNTSIDEHSVSSGSRADSDLNDFDSVMGGANNEAYTIDASSDSVLPSVHQPPSPQSTTVRL